MSVIYVVEEHDQVLDIWRAQQAHSLCLLHLDSHCDMRGLLINRRAQRAFRIWDMNPTVDQGNFLTHAILEGRVRSVRWVYGERGGRQYDVGTVKYETDLTAVPYRWFFALRGERGLPLHYEDLPYTEWNGLNEDEHLDIDWDFFASTLYPIETINDRVEAFLATEFPLIPEQVYACYSPDFSHPSRTRFQGFVADLAQIFKAQVVELQPRTDQPAAKPFYRKYLPPSLFQLGRRIYYNSSQSLRRRGIY